MLFFKQCPVSYNTPYEKIGDEVRSLADEVPFDIPNSWEWVRLSQIALVLNGDRGKNYPSKEKLVSSGIPFISALNLDGNTVINDANLLCVTEEQYNLLANGKLEKGDIVVCIRGSLGKHAKYPFEKGAIASSLVILRALCGDEALSDYIMMWLDSPAFFSEIRKYDNGTAQPNLAAKSLEQFFVPIPPISEQKRILEKLDKLGSSLLSYDAAHSKSHLLAATFPEALKKSILQEAVQGKLVPQDPTDESAEALLERIRAEKQRLIKEGKIKKDKHESIIFRRDNSHYEKLDGMERCIDDELPFEIPESWAWVRWGAIAESIQYGYNAPAKQEGRIRMVRISDIHENTVAWSSVPFCDIDDSDIPTYLLQANDILFARTGGTVGKSFLVSEVPCESIYAGYLIRTRYNSLLCPQYLKYFMESPLYWQQLKSGTTATAQPNCNGQTLAKMLLPLPPANEQLRIVDNLVRTFTIIEKM